MASVKKVEIVFPPGTEEYAYYQTGARGAVELAAKFGKCEDVHRAVKHLEGMPELVLEIGSGIGRASVYLFKVLGLDSYGTNFHLLDGDVGNKRALRTARKISGVYEKIEHTFYNSLNTTHKFCKANGIEKATVFNADSWGPGKAQPSVKYDLVYSFKAVGFHWPIREHLEWLQDILTPGALVIFEVRNGNSGKWDFTEDQIMTADGFVEAGDYEIVKMPGRREKFPLLVLRKV